MKKIKKSEAEWRRQLTQEQFKILRQKGTELPFTGKLLRNKETGDYLCAACKNPLFRSDTKFDSGTGWPSFDDSIKGSVELKEDKSLFMKRTEVLCKRCGSHLGHLFNDGLTKTKKRFCINSAALNFKNTRSSS